MLELIRRFFDFTGDAKRRFIYRCYNSLIWSVVPVIFYNDLEVLIIIICYFAWVFGPFIFTPNYITINQPDIKMRTKRILSFIFDICIINLIIMVVYNVAKLFYTNCTLYIVDLYITAIFLKDSFGMPSIGHKMVSLRICISGKPISPIFAFMRNLFFLIWPIDFLCFIIRGKRICDLIFKSEVIDSSQDKMTYKSNFLYKGLILFVIVFYTLSLLSR